MRKDKSGNARLVDQIRGAVRKRPYGVRQGQAAFNALWQLEPALANTIRGDLAGLDPFYNDGNLPAFYAWLEGEEE